MHISRKVFLLDNEPRCLLAAYDKDTIGASKAKRSEFKTFDDTIEVDDLVIVKTDTRHNFTVVKVVAVDVEPDLDSPVEINWVVSKFDIASYTSIVEQENVFLDAARKAEKKRRKAELKRDFLADVDTSTLLIKANPPTNKE